VSDLCPKHDLVTDEHGMCARCREELAGPKTARADSPATLGLVGLVVAAGVMAGVWLTSTGTPPTRAVQTMASAAASATNAVGEIARGVADEATGAAASAAPSASAEPVRAFDLEVQKQLQEAERNAAAAASAAAKPPSPPPAELEARRKRVVVDMYRATTCEECDVAARWMNEREIRVRQHDVTRDGSARERLLELNPSGSVPTFDVGGEVLVSFGPTELLRAIDVAARQPLDDE